MVTDLSHDISLASTHNTRCARKLVKVQLVVVTVLLVAWCCRGRGEGEDAGSLTSCYKKAIDNNITSYTSRLQPCATYLAMPPNHALPSSQALYSIFIRPALSPRPYLSAQTQCLRLSQSTHRTFASNPKAKPAPPKPKPVVTKTLLKKNPAAGLDPTKVILDESIGSLSAHFVDGSGTMQPAQQLGQLLRDIDRSTTHLRKVGETAEGIPVVKLVTNDELRDEARSKAKLKTVKKTDDMVKQIELNWAITGNDLGYRLDWLRRFMSEGRRVEILIAPKRRARRATKEEIAALMQTVRQAIADVEEGAEEWKTMLGVPGAQVTLYVQPKDGGGKAKEEKEAKKRGEKEDRFEKKEAVKAERQEKEEKRLAKKREADERLEKERNEKLNLSGFT